jgi:3-isopropylmalate/(R)-2-methylmalate dehydratase small subunit
VKPFTVVSGIAAPIPYANVDTDVIMPKQFLKGITREGLAAGVFNDLRYDGTGGLRPDFILNQSPYLNARFLVVGPNFGCGSSREHAVWGLQQFGIRALIGSTFASIFHDNCFKNGLLPVPLTPEQLEQVSSCCANPAHNTLCVDLVAQVIVLDDDSRINFHIDPLRREDLLQGRDAIETTLMKSREIADFEERHWAAWPWIKPQRSTP